MTQPGAVIHVVVPESLADQFLEQVRLFVGAFGRTETCHGFPALPVTQVCQTTGSHIQRLIPADLTEVFMQVGRIDIQPLGGRIGTPHHGLLQPVWVGDVAQAILRCLQDDATIGQTYELAGPGVWTLRQLVQAAGRWSGVRGGRGRPVIGLPPALGRMQAAALELLPGPPLMSRDNLDSLRVDNVASGALPGLQALGVQPAPLPPIAMRYLGEASEQALLDGYRRTAGR